MAKDEWKLAELAEKAGVSPRTVRYYVQRGLLPPPAFRGPDTAYGADHLLRLRAIRALQEAYYPLDAIQVELASRTPEQLEALASGRSRARAHAPSALPLPTAPPAVAAGSTPTRWERRVLAPGLELHVQIGGAHDDHQHALTKAIEGLVQENVQHTNHTTHHTKGKRR